MPINVKSTHSDEDLTIEMLGHIDEAAHFPQVKLRLSQRVIFECEKIEHISSFATHTWSNWMHALDPRQQFIFRMVPPRIVDIFNLVSGFLPPESVIESFFVPYECEKCDHEENILARRGREYIEALSGNAVKLVLPQEINCPKCKSGMKLGVWEAKFLRFLDGHQGRTST